jgi:maltose alpha-D-glucosyltransferase/alpha-amylase
MQLLREQLGQLPEASRPVAHEVLNLQKQLLEQAKAITGHKLNALRTRVHGDYHLGQVLFTGKDFIIIDFEGEPSRSLAERRLKRSPLFDVASMIRSFHYASRVGQFNMVRRGLGGSEALPALADAARLWYVITSVAFLRSYLRLAREGNFLPESLPDMERLLSTYLLEKACYELRYELNHRPDWDDVPMQGIIESARQM